MTGAFDPNAFANASETAGNGDRTPPPDPGTYEVVLDDAKAITKKDGTADFVILSLRVTAGPAQFIGHAWDVLYGFGSDAAYGVTKSVCGRLGVDINGVTSIQDLDGRLKPVVGNCYAIDVVQTKDVRYPHSVYFKDGGPITAGAVSDVTPPGAADDFAPAAAAGPVDDDIPF